LGKEQPVTMNLANTVAVLRLSLLTMLRVPHEQGADARRAGEGRGQEGKNARENNVAVDALER
jgi:hypothetical protein